MPDTVELSQSVTAWYHAARAATAEIARLTEIRDRACEHLQAAIGDAHQATIGGRPVITWKPSKPSLRLDRAALEDKFGADVIAGFLRESRPARPFRILDGDAG